MINRSTFPRSLFCAAFMAALLLVAPQSHAAMQTFEKEYTYTASELDSKSSCRAIALEQVKRILLQELGVYVESVFNDKASSDGRTPDEVRREITTLSAGVASTEVVEEKWDGQTYWLKARIKADPDDVAKKIEALRQDKQKVAELEESRKRAAELSRELERMRNELDATKSALSKAERARNYNDTAQRLGAEDLGNMGMILSVFSDSDYHGLPNSEKIILLNEFNDIFSRLPTEEKTKLTENLSSRPEFKALVNSEKIKILNFANVVFSPLPAEEKVNLTENLSSDFIGLLNQEAVEVLSRAIILNPKLRMAYFHRGYAYNERGDYQQAIRDFSKSIEIGPADKSDYFNRGISYYNRKDYQLAIEDFTKALKLDAKWAMPFGYRGNAYNALGDHKKAIKDYSKEIELDPKCATAYYNRGNVYSELGHTMWAIEDWKKAASLGYTTAQEILSKRSINWW